VWQQRRLTVLDAALLVTVVFTVLLVIWPIF
jgi:hypothetical protein